jgi:CheY-like chemotaxis protein
MNNNQPCDVLVVEDDVMQCEEIAGFFNRAGMSVVMAHNGVRAIEQATLHEPRVALLDYNLPGCTGLEVAEQIRARYANTAIIMMSGRIEGLSEKKIRELGITAFVNKPLPPGPLRQAVLKLVRSVPAERGGQSPANGWLAAGLGGTRH